jgi:parallel beta-helix repeat protein
MILSPSIPLSVFLLALAFVPADAHTIYVHPDSAISTIQGGLDLASAGDTVLVAEGTYVESLVWPLVHSVVLRSEMGADLTIVDADGAGHALAMSGNLDTTTVVDGFTFQNAHGAFWGGGVYLDETSPIIQNCIVRDNSCYESGGGILAYVGSDPIIRGNVITGNLADEGGGIGCVAGDPLILDNEIHDNIGNLGGGIFCYKTHNRIEDNAIYRNSATDCGGGVYIVQSIVELVDNDVHNDSTVQYGGGLSVFAAGIDAHGNRFHENYAVDSLSGVYVFEAWGSIQGNSIEGNYGYGMYCNTSAEPFDAKHNFWGDSTGPYHPLLNSDGLGDRVGDDIDFEPWLPTFELCGDATGDWILSPADGYLILEYLASGQEPVSCWAANANGLDHLTPADAFHLLNYLADGPDLNCQPCEFQRKVPISEF